jgi:hypothetical protein
VPSTIPLKKTDGTLTAELEMELEEERDENEKLRHQMAELEAQIKRERKQADIDKRAFQNQVLRRAQAHVEMDKGTYQKAVKHAKTKMFPRVKFITSDHEMEDLMNQQSMANIMMDELKIEREDRVAWWKTYKVALSDGIANRRSTVSMNLKEWIMRK